MRYELISSSKRLRYKRYFAIYPILQMGRLLYIKNKILFKKLKLLKGINTSVLRLLGIKIVNFIFPLNLRISELIVENKR